MPRKLSPLIGALLFGIVVPAVAQAQEVNSPAARHNQNTGITPLSGATAPLAAFPGGTPPQQGPVSNMGSTIGSTIGQPMGNAPSTNDSNSN